MPRPISDSLPIQSVKQIKKLSELRVKIVKLKEPS